MGAREFGSLLASRRDAAGLTQAELGHVIRKARQQVGAIEAGDFKWNPDAMVLNAIAERLGNVTVMELLDALGYDVGCPDVTVEDVGLLAAYHRLSPPIAAWLREQILATPSRPLDRE